MCDGEICQLMSQPAAETEQQDQNFRQQQQHQQQNQVVFQRQNAGGKQCIENCDPSVENNTFDLNQIEVSKWQHDDVIDWIESVDNFSQNLIDCLRTEDIDGEVLLALNEQDVRDMRYKLGYKLTFGELKRLWLAIYRLQLQEQKTNGLQWITTTPQTGYISNGNGTLPLTVAPTAAICPCPDFTNIGGYSNVVGVATSVAPEYFKTTISLCYSFLVTWITSFVMVIVHERVPDMKRYPPLPDIFLDNVPHIPWAFNMCEITGSLLFSVWLMVLIFHKYRLVLLRRFFALAGTVFLLRCVTMLITSLSVPGTHLQCSQKDFAIDDPNVDMMEALWIRMQRAYNIWSGLGMSIQGVRTCGDYMFSGHTVALTLLNFFITEYTPRNLYFLHTLTWLLNMFGIFFILAAHEHYSIDVFVAFYITSRLFLYYHTLANNQALMQIDSTRTRIWFPMFSYFESSVDGIIPNEFETPGTLIDGLLYKVLQLKSTICNILRQYWIDARKTTTTFVNRSESDADLSPTTTATTRFFSPHQSFINSNTTAPTISFPPQVRRSSTPLPKLRITSDIITNATTATTTTTAANNTTVTTSNVAEYSKLKLT